jgi:arylsulfatase A-like enzyme
MLQVIQRVGIGLKLMAPSGEFDPRNVFTAAQTLIKSGFAKPTLLWVHSMGPHGPYAAAPPFLQSFDPSDFALTRLASEPPVVFFARFNPDFPQRYVGRYDEAVAANDAALGKFLDSLVKQGLYDDALIVITADHGESFGHSYGGHGGPGLYEDLIRIPLLIKLPGQQAGQRISTPAQQVDILATVRDVLGLPADSFAEGRSLLSAMRGAVESETVYSMNFEQSRPTGSLANGSVAMIDGPWKYIHYFGKQVYPQMPVLEDVLYDLDRDPDELSSQIKAQPERSRSMQTQIEAQLALHGKPLQ